MIREKLEDDIKKISKFHKIKEKITISQKILDQIDDLDMKIKITSKKEKERLMNLRYELEKKIDDVKNLNKSLMILSFLLYFSFISYIIPDMFLLSDLKNAVSKIISLFGTTVIIVLIALINTSKKLLYTDINLNATRIISIYTKYEK